MPDARKCLHCKVTVTNADLGPHICQCGRCHFLMLSGVPGTGQFFTTPGTQHDWAPKPLEA